MVSRLKRTTLSYRQERALENGGLDLTHYTPSFSDAVFDEIYQLHVAGRMADVGGDISFAETEPGAAVAAKLARALDVDDFKSVARKVFAAIRETPAAAVSPTVRRPSLAPCIWPG